MLHDTTSMNPKGRVKIELYNDKGIYFTKEKKNLVVLDANKIVANMMADPSKNTRISQADNGNSSITPNADGTYTFSLSIQREKVTTINKDVPSDNTETILSLPNSKITKLLSVKEGETDLTINQDVFIKDAEKGLIEFATAPTAPLTIKFQYIINPLVQIIEGTETVTIGNTKWKRSNVASNANQTYQINYETGEIYFETSKANVNVSYDYNISYSLGFMALGGKPEGHLDYKPVSFANVDKILTEMKEELPNSRVPIQFPASVETGKPEVEVLPTKTIQYEERTVHVVAADLNADDVIDQIYDIDNSGSRILQIVSAKKVTNPDDPVDLVVGTDIQINDDIQGTIRFTNTPEENDEFDIVYRIQKNDDHLIYQLSQSPVVELVSIVHEHAVTGVKTAFTQYDPTTNPDGKIKNRGLSIGVGEVWLMNPNAGIVQFSSNVENVITQPGQLTFEYKVNSGTVVKFVADFPKGVPGPIQTTQAETFVSNGETTFVLSHPIMKDTSGNFEVISVKRNNNPETYTVHPDGTMIDVANVQSGDTIIVEYKFAKDTHEIYQVAMFDGLDKATSKMFNISGIGPITKDKNTGMRVTWSVTF